MTNEEDEVTEADVATLKQKLGDFTTALTPAEQTILGYVLERAGSDPETAGYSLPTVLSPAVVLAIQTNLLGIRTTGSLPGGLQQLPGRFAMMNQ
jgi:hypothetical protein